MAALSLLPVLELEDVPANKLAGTGIFTDAVGRLETARWPKCVFALKLLRLVEFCRLCCSVTIRPLRRSSWMSSTEEKAPNPVLTPDEEELRRMDIFACAARNTEDANGSAIQENLVVELKAPKVVLTKAVLRQIEDYMDYVRKQPLFNSQYRRWKFIAVCSAVDDDVKARYDSQKSKGKKGLVAEIDNYEVYALTWDDVFQSFDLRHAFLLDKLKMDKEAIAAEIAQTAGDEKSKDTADALTALVAN